MHIQLPPSMPPTSFIPSLAIPLVLILAPFLFGVTPLNYRTYAIAQLEARVEKICTIRVPTQDTNKSMSKRGSVNAIQQVEVQIISLKVTEIEKFVSRHPLVPAVHQGEVVKVSNPYQDRVPPFQVGDTIKVKLRLVLPEERFDPKDPRKQWWFFPEGANENILPPRYPFAGIRILD